MEPAIKRLMIDAAFVLFFALGPLEIKRVDGTRDCVLVMHEENNTDLFYYSLNVN